MNAAGFLLSLRQQSAEHGEHGPLEITDAAAVLGVELRGDEGHPFCCGSRMLVKGGICGVDYARCEACGNYLYRIDSPHTNGGAILSDEALDDLGDAVWMARPPESAAGGRSG